MPDPIVPAAQSGFQLWQIVLGLGGSFLGGGAFAQWVKNRGDASSKGADELSKLRQELWAQLKEQKAEHEKECAELKKEFEAKIAKLEDEAKDREKRLKETEDKQKEFERLLMHAEVDREAFENRVLFVLRNKWGDKDAADELAEEIELRHEKNRKARKSRRALGHKCILIVDDENDLAVMMKRAVIDEGHEALIANSGEAALNQLRESYVTRARFDLVLMDSRMPQMDGAQTARRIREIEGGRSEAEMVPILFVTADSQTISMADMQSVQALGVLNKPFAPDELKAKLQEVFAK